MKNYSILEAIFADTEWHRVGNATDNYVLLSVGGVPIDTIDLPVDIIPDTNTKATYVLGGVVQGCVTKDDHQTWCRVKQGIGKLHYHLAESDGYDEMAAIKSSIIDLTTQVIHLSGRTLKLELSSGDHERWKWVIEKVVAQLQGMSVTTMSMLLEHQVRNIQFQSKIRNYVSGVLFHFQNSLFDSVKTLINTIDQEVFDTSANFNTLCDSLTEMSEMKDVASLNIVYDDIMRRPDTNEVMQPVVTSVRDLVHSHIKTTTLTKVVSYVQGHIATIYATCMDLVLSRYTDNKKTLNQAIDRVNLINESLQDQINNICIDLMKVNTLLGVDSSDEDIDNALTTKNLETYWTALIEFTESGGLMELDEKYALLINQSEFDKEFLPVVQAVYEMVKATFTLATWVDGVTVAPNQEAGDDTDVVPKP